MIEFDVLYNRLSVPSLRKWVESVALVERSGGNASTLTLQLCNVDGRFLGPWRATKGDSIALSIPPASVSTFSITKIGANRSPAVVTWEAEGRPATTSAPTGRGKGTPPPSSGAIVEDKRSWDAPLKAARIKDIALRVCAECGLSLKYTASNNPVISYVARYNETGFHLLSRLCRRYALSVRASAGAVIITADRSSADSSPPASIRLSMSEIKGLSQAQDMKAKSVRSARLDPRGDKPVRMSAGDGDGTDIDLDYDADDATALYATAVASADQATVDIVPRPGIVPGSIVDIEGVGLREVVEMRYNRTGDTESMSLTVRGT